MFATKTEIFAFIAVLVLKLFSRKVLLIKKKTIETVKKGCFLRNQQISRVSSCKIINR